MTRLASASALAPISDAVVLAGGLAFLSGQGPVEDGRLSLGALAHETTLTLQNLLSVVTSLGGNKQSIVRCTCYLADLADVPAFNEIYADFFGDCLPARTAVGAALQGGMKVEAEAVVQLDNRDAAAKDPRR